MSGISTEIIMIDNMSPILNSIMTSLNSVNTAFQSVHNTVDTDMDSRGFDSVRDSIESTTAAASMLENQMADAMRNTDTSQAVREQERLRREMESMQRPLQDNEEAQRGFNREVENGQRQANNLRRIITSVVGAFSVRAGIGWLRESMNITNENIRLEQQLANVMSNRGATYEEFVRIQERAAKIQADTNDMISATTMMGAANELSRHVGSVEAIEIMMGSLADFASGAGNIFGATAQDMAAYAEYFTQAMAGNYRMLERRAGIYLTDIQKDVIKYGDDMQRALMIQDIVNQSWAGLAEQMSQTPEGMRTGMINAFNDIRNSIGAQLMPVMMTLFATIRTNMPMIEQAIQALIPIIQMIINLGMQIISLIVSIGNFANTHLGGIENLIWAILIGVTALKAGMFAWQIATLGVAAAKVVLKKALISTGIGALVVLIGYIILAIYNWIQSIGGLEVAWLYAVHGIMTAWDVVKIGFFTGVHFVMDLWDRMALGMQSAGTAIANFMGDMRTNVLTTLQNMVNGAIDIINRLINAVSNLPMVSIDTIDRITFAVGAEMENYAARNARNAALDGYRSQVESAIAERAAMREQMILDAQAARADRLNEIQALRDAAAYGAGDYAYSTASFLQHNFTGDGLEDIARDIADIAANTGTMANISGENLKYWRDIAERDNINRFTTAKVNLRIAGIHNTVNHQMDLDGVVDYITEGLEEALEVTAERSNDYV